MPRTAAKSRPDASPSFVELATERAVPSLEAAVSAVRAFPKDAAPHAPVVQKTRSALREAKLLLDVFEPAFGGGDEGGPDAIVQLRRELNQAYEKLGDYKDLALVAGADVGSGSGRKAARLRYPRKQLAQRQRALQEALRSLRKVTKQVAPLEALACDATPLVQRPAQDRSRFFWAAVPIEPDAERPGTESVARLFEELLGAARGELAALEALQRPESRHDVERIHDLRKRLRAAHLLLDVVPELEQKGKGARRARATLRQAVRAFEGVQDLAVRRRAAKSPQAGRELQRRLEQRWQEVLVWQREAGLDAALARLERTTVAPTGT